MNFQFENNQKYTLVAIDAMSYSTRIEMDTLGTDPKSGRMIFKIGRKKKYYLVPMDLNDKMVFKGHKLPFKLNSETRSFVGNALFNFVTEDLPALKSFLIENCLTPSIPKFQKVKVWGTDRSDIDFQESVNLFSEEELIQLFHSAAG